MMTMTARGGVALRSVFLFLDDHQNNKSTLMTRGGLLTCNKLQTSILKNLQHMLGHSWVRPGSLSLQPSPSLSPSSSGVLGVVEPSLLCGVFLADISPKLFWICPCKQQPSLIFQFVAVILELHTCFAGTCTLHELFPLKSISSMHLQLDCSPLCHILF